MLGIDLERSLLDTHLSLEARYQQACQGHKVMIGEGEGDKAKFRELILL